MYLSLPRLLFIAMIHCFYITKNCWRTMVIVWLYILKFFLVTDNTLPPLLPTFILKLKLELIILIQPNQLIFFVTTNIFEQLNVFSSVAKLSLCDPMDCSTPGLPIHQQLPEPTQTHVHWVSDVIQPSNPLLAPFPALNLSQHQGLFKWVSSSHQVAKVLEFQL